MSLDKVNKELAFTPIPEQNLSFSSELTNSMKIKGLQLSSGKKEKGQISHKPTFSEGSTFSRLNSSISPAIIKKLSRKFGVLYQELKTKKDKSNELDQDNQQLAIMIKEEFYKRKAIFMKYDEELKSLRELGQDIDKHISEDSKSIFLINEINAKDDLINQLKEKTQTTKDELKAQEIMISTEKSKKYHIENENYKLNRKYKEYQVKVNNLNSMLLEEDMKLKNLKEELEYLNDKDIQLHDEINQTLNEDNDKDNLLKELIENYRSQLIKHSQLNQEKDEAEKILEKFVQELQNRIHRFEVLLVTNAALEKKINSLNELQETHFKEANILADAKEENEILKTKVGISSENSIFEEKPERKNMKSSRTMMTNFSPRNNTTTASIKSTMRAISPIDKKRTLSMSSSISKKQNKEDIQKSLLVSELERLKLQISSQTNYITELQKNLDEREKLIQDQKQEMTSVQNGLKTIDIDIERSQKMTLNYQSNYQTQSLILKRMENKYNQSMENFSEKNKKTTLSSEENEVMSPEPPSRRYVSNKQKSNVSNGDIKLKSP